MKVVSGRIDQPASASYPKGLNVEADTRMAVVKKLLAGRVVTVVVVRCKGEFL